MQSATPEQLSQLLRLASILREGLSIVCDTTNYPINVYTSEDRTSLVLDGPQFVFLMLHPTRNSKDMMTLHLEVDMKSARAAAIVKTISNFIESKRWRLGEEFYFDESDNTVTYGEEARIKKKEKFINNNGFETCLFCESVVQQGAVTDTGCPLCQHKVTSMLWS